MGLGRGWVWVAGLLVAVAVLTACHEPGRTRGVKATAALEPEVLDFGEVPVGEWRELPVRIRNIGQVPFSALDALGLEGNPSFEVVLRDEGRVDPGKEARVLVRFHPLAEGPHQDTVRVDTDANAGSDRPIPVRGQGGPLQVEVEPALLDFETLELDSERALPVTVRNPVDLPLALAVVGEGEVPFRVNLGEVPPHDTVTLDARYHPRALGRQGARLEVRPCPSCTPTRVDMTGQAVESAFVFDPAPVPFEQIPVHERTRSTARARNVTWRAVDVSGVTTSDRAFTPLADPAGTRVGPGGALEVPLEFAARYSGPNTGTLNVGYTSDRARLSRVLLDAGGGQPTLALTPVSIDFGELPVGGKLEQVVRLTNAGTRGDLHFRGLRAEGAVGQFGAGAPRRGAQALAWTAGTAWPALGADNLPIAPGGDAIDVPIYFEPQAPGPFEATLYFGSDDPFTPERTVKVTGRARASGPCVYELRPQPAIDFGNVVPGRGAVLGFYFKNVGPAECAVKDIHLSKTAGGAFFMPGGALTGGVVPYDTAFSAMVAFRPPFEGHFEGELMLTVNNPAYPTVTLPLRGVSQRSCLVATPSFLDFGAVRYDCAPQPRSTVIANRCSEPINVSSLELGTGTSDQFSIVQAPPLPRTLAPGEGFEVTATYSRTVHGQHYSPLYVTADSEPYPFLIPLVAETNHEGLQVDQFIQGNTSQLDVLFVVGNTTTMAPFQRRLADALPGWLERARGAGLDVQAGVTTTGLVPRAGVCGGPAEGGEGGRLVPLDGSGPRWVSSAQATAGVNLAANADVGACHNLVQGLETMRQALSSPLVDSADDPRTALPQDGNAGLVRPSARMAVVALADEDDHSGFSPETYVQFLQALKGTGMAHRSQLYALVPTDGSCETAGPTSERWAEVARRTGGAVGSVCQGGYGTFLDRLIERAGPLQADFPLTATPDGNSGMQVTVGGDAVPDGAWRYDAERNAIVFGSGSVPQPGQQIQVRYRAVCQPPPPPPPP